MIKKTSLRNSFNINTLLIYTVFLFIGLNIKLFSGLYIYNLIVFVFIILNIKYIKINKQILNITALIFLFNIISILIQILFFGIEPSIASLYIIYNYILLISFIIFIKEINVYNLNYNVIIFFLSIPIFLSIAMFFNLSIESYFLNFFHIEKYPAFGRYGGVFGRDVNALGIYSSLLLLFSVILYRFRLINVIVVMVILFSSLFTISLSGMRTGLLVFFGGLILFNKKLKILNYWYVVLFIVVIFLIISSIYNYNSYIQHVIDFMYDRFSISGLLKSAGLQQAEHSNLQTAIEYFYRTLGDKEFNVLNSLFGISFNLSFIDNFYIFVFIKYGIILDIVIVSVGLYMIYYSYKKRDFITSYFIIVSFIIAIKGIFVLNNFYMFLVVFIIYLWKNHKNITSLYKDNRL